MDEQSNHLNLSSKHPDQEKSLQKQMEVQEQHKPLPPEHSVLSDSFTWRAYWETQNLRWRTGPEISLERQKELGLRQKIFPDVTKSIYPFHKMKLDRGDVEWLLATHDEGRGPVDWAHNQDRERSGLDVRGADLCQADLRQLPLTKLRGGLVFDEDVYATEQQRKLATVMMDGADLRGAKLEGANLRNIKLGDKHGIGPLLADTQWGTTNLGVVDWSKVTKLGDERLVEQKKRYIETESKKHLRLDEYQAAVRANRQLAVALQAQGLNEVAARFAYRAQRLQRIILRLQKKIGQYLFSVFLDLIAGYGYRPGRCVIAYLAIIFGFMSLYLLNAHIIAPHLRWDEALVLSISSFHGRGFFSQDISLGDTYARLAAAEAVIGLIIEISFIATFTQRFLGK